MVYIRSGLQPTYSYPSRGLCHRLRPYVQEFMCGGSITSGTFALGSLVWGFYVRTQEAYNRVAFYVWEGGYLRKRASVRVAYVMAHMTRGLCLGAFVQEAFGPWAYVKGLITGGLCVGVSARGRFGPRLEGLISASLCPGTFTLRGLWSMGLITLVTTYDRC